MSTATPAPSSRRCSRTRWIASPKSSRVEVNASTRLLAVIGDPVAHSLSPSMHNAAIGVLGLDAVYVALRTPAPALVTVLAARDAGRARDFADWARQQGTHAAAARGTLEPDIAINATPAGLKDTDPLPLDPDSAARLHAALDLVYAPGGTRWVRTLTAAGVRAQDGREVLVHQGAAAFARFFPDQTAPLEVMRAAVNRALGA